MAKDTKSKPVPINDFNPFPIQRDILRMLGAPYKLKTKVSQDKFDEMWKINRHARELAKRIKTERENEVIESFKRLGKLVNGKRLSARGHCKVKKVDLKNGPFVVFSDHHMAQRGHPIDFFHRKNMGLYKKVLTEYSKQQYTLVENGDLEELVILDLTLKEAQQFWNTFKKAKYITEPELRRVGYLALRKKKRIAALKEILKSYESLYKLINKEFHSRGKLIRLAGNHDQDLQDPEFLKVLRQTYPNITVYDYLFLNKGLVKRKGGKAQSTRVVEYIVGHGHQFDTVTTPKYARLLGEIYSECMSWGFEGPDRVWRWEDDCYKWIEDKKPFLNRLVAGHAGSFGEGLINDSLTLIYSALGNKKKRKELKLKDSAAKAAIEGLVGNNIAWDYFESRTALGALFTEVFEGNEFFKFRHLDELVLQKEHRRCYVKSGVTTPRLILGHTHEVRHRAIGEGNKTIDYYLNSGAAGRFENLIWAIEIEGNTERVVGWSLDSAGKPQKTVFPPSRDKLVPTSVPNRLKPVKSKPVVNVTRYSVVKGDSLSEIAAKFWKDVLLWPILYDANKRVIGPDWNLIKPGQVLVVPDISGYSSLELSAVRSRGRNWK